MSRKPSPIDELRRMEAAETKAYAHVLDTWGNVGHLLAAGVDPRKAWRDYDEAILCYRTIARATERARKAAEKEIKP